MNVFDWDKTIYDGDCSVDFYKYCLKRFKGVATLWPSQAKAAALYKAGKITKTEMKDTFYRYFTKVPNIKEVVVEFWAEYDYKIKDWYYEMQREDDLIISASPEFLLEPICKQLNVAMIASVVDPLTGKNLKPNCFGSEKVVRMKEHYNINDMEEFYSDSYSDDPLAQYASRAFYVVGNELTPW